MKILHIIPALIKGGAERLAIDICQELKQKGHEVRLVVFRTANDYAHLCDGLDITVLPVFVTPSVLGKWKISIDGLNQFIETFVPDIIHSHLFEAEMVSRENPFRRAKYFTHCHDNMPQLRNFSARTVFNKKSLTDYYEKAHLVKHYLKCDNKFIAISDDTKMYFEKVLPISLSKNISLLNNGINFKRFNAVNNSRVLNNVRIINVGSFVPKKNQVFFISIAQELRSRGLAAEIKLLGDGPLFNEVKSKVENAGLQGFISMPGNVKHVEEYYAHANVYVHTANYEPFGLVLLEAMASGLPVVSLDGRGNRGLIKDGENGFMFTEQNASMFVDAILNILDKDTHYKTMSENAVAFSGQFDITAYTDRLIEIYNRS